MEIIISRQLLCLEYFKHSSGIAKFSPISQVATKDNGNKKDQTPKNIDFQLQVRIFLSW